MNWYRENRWLGNFFIASGSAALLALWFLLHSQSGFGDAAAEFNAAATERSRLEHLNPFPSEDNFRKTQAALETYSGTLNKLKDELRAQMPPPAPMAPNEFQTHLRQGIVGTTEKARGNRVKVPENFHLGFDEFATGLPGNAALAGVLEQELGQIERLLEILIDARVDAIASLKRLPPETVTATTPLAPAPAKKQDAAASVVERSIVDVTFTSSPAALRKVLNQIASSERQFFVIRTLYVRNEQLKGPSRDQIVANTTTVNAAQPNAALKFIVGNEHVEATAKIELVRFAF